MPADEREADEAPKKWVPEGRRWPTPPFTTPPEGAEHDLVEVEQLAAIMPALDLAAHKAGLTQKQWAARARVNYFTLNKALNGAVFPPLEVLLRMAAAVGMQLFPRPWPQPLSIDEIERTQWPEVIQPAWVEQRYVDAQWLEPRPAPAEEDDAPPPR